MERTLRGFAVGTSYGVATRVLRLPFNPRFQAHNILELEVDRGVLDEANDFYQRHRRRRSEPVCRSQGGNDDSA